jgi:hypothetical protein
MKIITNLTYKAMNKERREELYDVTQLLDEAIDRLSEIRDDEQDAYDALPEGFQMSSRGASMEEAMDTLDGFERAIMDISSQIEAYANPKKKKKA